MERLIFQFLRTEHRMEEVEFDWGPDETPMNAGPAPTLLGTRMYHYQPDSDTYYDTYYNHSPDTLLDSAEEFAIHDGWMQWEVVFAVVFAHRSNVQWN